VDILCMNHTEIEAVYMIEMCSTHGDLVWWLFAYITFVV
jgi:hypothetical protein